MKAFENDGFNACAVDVAEDEKTIMVRIPESLLKRVEEVQEEIFSAPDIRGLGLRKSRAQAVRILIIKALDDLERKNSKNPGHIQADPKGRGRPSGLNLDDDPMFGK